MVPPPAARAALAGEAGAGKLPGPDGRTAARLTARRRRQVGAGKGQEFNVGCGGSGSGGSWACGGRDGPMTGPSGNLLPCPGLIMPSVLQLAGVAGLAAQADRTPARRRKGFHPLQVPSLILARGMARGRGGGSWERDTGRRSGPGLLLGPVLPDSHINLISELLSPAPGRPGCGRLARGAAWPGRGTRTPSPPPGPLGTRHRTQVPVRLRLGPA